MLVTGPSTSVRVEEKALFVFVCDVLIQILSNGELPVELCVPVFVSDAILDVGFTRDGPVPTRRRSLLGKESHRRE